MLRGTANILALLLVVLPAASVDAAQPPVMTPGLWEVTIKTEFQGSTPTTVTEICISKEQAERPEPPKTNAKHDCQVAGGLTGNLLKYTVKCSRKLSTTQAEFVYSGDHYEGVVTIKIGDSGEVRQVHTAKRLGDCEERE